jgi:hypothetical protein
MAASADAWAGLSGLCNGRLQQFSLPCEDGDRSIDLKRLDRSSLHLLASIPTLKKKSQTALQTTLFQKS